MNRIVLILLITVILLLIDYYFFQAIIAVSKNWSALWKNFIRIGFWAPTVITLVVLLWWFFGDPYRVSANFRNWMITGIVAVYFPKLFGIIFLLVDDLQRGAKWLVQFIYKGAAGDLPGEGITRSEFLTKSALVATAIPFGAFAYGIISGAHDYRIKRIMLKLPNLPKAFDGFRIGQISDIHSGSFYNKTAVEGGVSMMNKEKPDVLFFTGDLVNNETSEIKDYKEVFGKLNAPFGVMSVTGNHDYGDYRSWSSAIEKQKNFGALVQAHKEMGYDILMNEHRLIVVDGEKIAILGIENWGTGRFPKYGDLSKAYLGTSEAPVKILLSHDPSHWDAQVRPEYNDIDLMLAGHTHGFQFGVEIGGFKWSPSQYVYKQWAGLYQVDNQFLYVNRGFGFIGYPGRIGIPPELTIIELKQA